MENPCLKTYAIHNCAGGLRLWTHFDVMSNMLCQICGTKQVRLWPPSQVHQPFPSEQLYNDFSLQGLQHPSCICMPAQLYRPASWVNGVGLSVKHCRNCSRSWSGTPHGVCRRRSST